MADTESALKRTGGERCWADGNLFEQVEKTIELLLTKYLKAFIHYEGLQRIERFLFPEGALREALLNAIVHKDYSSGIPIQISVYDDRIVIWNSGQLPPGWTLQRFLGKHPSSPANPLLANAFFRSGYIESWGRGIEKIARECREHDIEPPGYDFEMSGLMLTFIANPTHTLAGDVDDGKMSGKMSGKMPGKMSGKMSGKMPGKMLSKTKATIVTLMRENPEITIPEIARKTGRLERTIEKLVRNLKADEIIGRVGPAKGGYWKVLE